MKKRVFKRKIYDKIVDWKARKNGSTALLIKGARRVGKSTIANDLLVSTHIKHKSKRDYPTTR